MFLPLEGAFNGQEYTAGGQLGYAGREASPCLS